ncbi:MAG: glucosamine-6-phosphate deaminase [Flavobacteriales bacterium]|nr:glucosamine-6-phosphate deaminase [Flavobacteriales bacterium]
MMTQKKTGRWEDMRFEKIHTEIFQKSSIASVAVAEEIAAVIRDKNAKGQKAVLGLVTGSTPMHIYSELIRMHREEGLSFANVVTFNLNEYYGLSRENAQSYWAFMHEHLFDHIDILPENINIPDGNVPLNKLDQYCADYDMKIKSYGGLDIQLVGIGRTGNIGFNEPGSHINSGTRMITLDHLTRSDASKDFHGLENVPKRAITMGVGSILKARRIILLAWGNKKAEIIKRTVEGEVSSTIPATYLQTHNNCTIMLDEVAAEELTRIKTPWIVGPCTWDEAMQRKGIVWLSSKVSKPILKLTDRDYNDNSMSTLLAQEGSAYALNIKMFNVLQHTITGWPGGKPNSDDSARPERATPAKKRVIVFSPHPDDAVIGMGGTIRRLVEQGHDVYVVIQTSGNNSVSDNEARRFVEFAEEFYEFQTGEEAPSKVFNNVKDVLITKEEGSKDAFAARKAKALIRRGEAMSSLRFMGVPDQNVIFLDLPFYETGSVKKLPIGKKDMSRMVEVIKKIKPHQIFAAGDLSDPHGTQKISLDLVFTAIAQLKSEKFMKDCWVWLYRGAWSEWNIEQIGMAVPLSPDELRLKKRAIFFHESQKNDTAYLGEDPRDFWQRAEDRNKGTAIQYHDLGFSDYEAMEAFNRYFY